MVGDLARDEEVTIPISGIGGVSAWRDAVEFLLMGATSVQVGTALAMAEDLPAPFLSARLWEICSVEGL